MLPWCQQLQETDTGTQRDISAAIILRCKLTEYLRTNTLQSATANNCRWPWWNKNKGYIKCCYTEKYKEKEPVLDGCKPERSFYSFFLSNVLLWISFMYCLSMMYCWYYLLLAGVSEKLVVCVCSWV